MEEVRLPFQFSDFIIKKKTFNEMLEALGMEIAFTSPANFGGISDIPIWIGYVKQKAFIEVMKKVAKLELSQL